MSLIIPGPLASFSLHSHHTVSSLIAAGLSLSTREVQTVLGVCWLLQHGPQVSADGRPLADLLVFLLQICTQHL